jgi:hypothetical protein
MWCILTLKGLQFSNALSFEFFIQRFRFLYEDFEIQQQQQQQQLTLNLFTVVESIKGSNLRENK